MDDRALLELVGVLLASPVVLLLVHAILQRVRRAAPPQRVAMATCVAGIIPVGALIGLVVPVRDAVALLYVAVVYGGIAYAYFHLFNMSETARRIRVLREVERAGGLAEADLRRLYSEDEVVDRRLERMIAMGHLVQKDDGRFVVGSPLLLSAARVIAHWRKILGFETAR